MDHRKISSVMTPAERVTAVPVDAGFKDIAEALAAHGVGAVPVVDAERHVLGVVSEGDLLAKEARLETEPENALGLLFQHPEERREMHKAAATTALDLMTAPPVTIGAHQDVVEAARLMADREVKRLVVTDADGRLLGVVSRHDVLKVFTRTDEDIRREVAEDVLRGMFHLDAASVAVRVEEGVVTLRGSVATEERAEQIRGTVRRTDGVVGMVDEIVVG